MKKITFRVNGVQHEWIAEPKTALLDVLRDDMRLTGAKQSCDRKGQCGACMVIVNKKAVRSCLTRIGDLEGAEVITVEGLGTPANPHFIQQAFVLSGAIQCGFCTPGMIMATKALLDVNLNPNRDEIVQALRGNLCRCTGYAKIFEAVELAARFLRGEVTPEEMTPKMSETGLGVAHPRPSAMAKACGTAHFTADFRLSGALELVVLRSTIPHARIVSIDSKKAESMPGVVGVMTATDIQGTNILKYLQADRPVLCRDKVRYIGDPILAIAATTKAQAEAALATIKVELEPLPILDSPATSMAEGAPQLHDEFPNVCYNQPQVKGDAAAALAQSHAVIETKFKTQINHQAPLEPEATIAYWEKSDDPEEEDKLVVVGRSINIHYHLAMIQAAIGYENMRYIEAYAGGQFGIKIDVISEGIAAAAALHFRRAIRYIPSLTESMQMSSKRHSFSLDVKLGADKDGMLTAYCNDFVVDKGAYYSIGHVVVYRALLMLSGSYNIPNVDARGRLVYTNNPWGSAARGAGPPQANFALECAVEMLAEKMGIDPLEFRLRNSLKPGQSKSTGRTVTEWPLPELLESVRPHYERAIKDAAPFKTGKIRRGVGIATGSFGIGGPGDVSVASVELDDDGGISIYAAAADPGEGNDSMLTQLTSAFMNLPVDRIRLHTRDTDNTAASGPAAGSRITYMIGGALIDGLTQLKAAMTETCAKTGADLEAAGKNRKFLGRKKNEDAGPLDPKTGQGPSFESQVHAVQLAEVEVDIETGKVKVLKMTAAVDAGPVINPLNLTGQLEGGLDMGVGLALREEYIAGKTKDWVTFKFPTIRDHFPMEIITRETPRPKGPLATTGIGEMCLVPTAPAVINAINNAAGVWIRELPATPDKIKAALAAKG
jgi:aldehyde oxidoreductase